MMWLVLISVYFAYFGSQQCLVTGYKNCVESFGMIVLIRTKKTLISRFNACLKLEEVHLVDKMSSWF